MSSNRGFLNPNRDWNLPITIVSLLYRTALSIIVRRLDWACYENWLQRG